MGSDVSYMRSPEQVGKEGMGSQLLDFGNIHLNGETVDWSLVDITALSSQDGYDGIDSLQH